VRKTTDWLLLKLSGTTASSSSLPIDAALSFSPQLAQIPLTLRTGLDTNDPSLAVGYQRIQYLTLGYLLTVGYWIGKYNFINLMNNICNVNLIIEVKQQLEI